MTILAETRSAVQLNWLHLASVNSYDIVMSFKVGGDALEAFGQDNS